MIQTGNNFINVYQGLKEFFNKIQDKVETQIFDNANKLPLLGDELKKLKDDASLQYFENLRNKFEQLQPEGSSGVSSVLALKQSLEEILGKTIEVIENTDEVTFSVDLTESKNFNTQLASGLGLSASELELNTSGSAETDLNYGLKLKFGLNKTDGFYIDTAGQDELKLDLSIAPEIKADATIGFLEFNAQTDADAKLQSSFAIDLQDSDTKLTLSELGSLNFAPKLSNSGKIILDLEGKTSEAFLPKINTKLNLSYDNQGGASFQFTDVTVDLGSFIQPLLEKINEVTEPISNLIEPLTEPLPILNRSLVDLAVDIRNISSSPTADYAENAKRIQELVNVTEIIGDKLNNQTLSLASLNSQDGSTTPSNSLEQKASDNQLFSDLKPEDKQKLDESGLKLPILTNTVEVLNNLLLSKNVDLFSYTTPEFNFNLDLNNKIPSIPVFGPVVVKFSGDAKASAQINLGFDQLGFYLSDTGGSAANLSGTITAGAGVSAAIADVTVGGGIALSVDFPLSGAADKADGMEDKKIRGSALDEPLCLFEPTGELSAIIFGAVSVGTGFFSYTKRLNLS